MEDLVRDDEDARGIVRNQFRWASNAAARAARSLALLRRATSDARTFFDFFFFENDFLYFGMATKLWVWYFSLKKNCVHPKVFHHVGVPLRVTCVRMRFFEGE